MTGGAFCVIFMVILKRICHLAQIVIACKWPTTCYYFSNAAENHGGRACAAGNSRLPEKPIRGYRDQGEKRKGAG
jgi:hypothetical protein